MKAGVDRFLAKPLHLGQLARVVNELFGGDQLPAKEAKKQAKVDLRGVSLLLVEDNLVNQEVAAGLLQGAGARVAIAANGHEALQTLRNRGRHAFAAVLMDVQMPGMDGIEATREIRRLQGFEDLPIIGLTAHALTEERQRCLEEGMDDYVTKPIDPAVLFAALQPFVGQVRDAAQTGDARASHGLPPIEGLRSDEGLMRIGGNVQLYRRVLRMFVDLHGSIHNEIERHWHGGEQQEAARLAHMVKGEAGNVGAAEIYQVAGALEKAIVDNRGQEVGELLARLESILTGFSAAVRAALDAEEG